MEILKGFFDNVQNNPEYLNNTRTRSIQVCFDPEKLPNMVRAFKLSSHDTRCHITFSKETMNAINEKTDEISRGIREGEEKIFLLNDELKVFSERIHNRCVVCFLNFQGVRIDILIDAFNEMTNISRNMFTKRTDIIEQNLLKTAQNLKQFLDALLIKHNQCDVNNPEFEDFLQQLYQYVSSFDQGGSTFSDENIILDLSDNDNEIDDEDYENDMYVYDE